MDVELKAETVRIKRNIQVLISRETSDARTEIMYHDVDPCNADKDQDSSLNLEVKALVCCFSVHCARAPTFYTRTTHASLGSGSCHRHPFRKPQPTNLKRSISTCDEPGQCVGHSRWGLRLQEQWVCTQKQLQHLCRC